MLELPLFPVVTHDVYPVLHDYLSVTRRWVKRDQLATLLGVPVRTIRDAASHSNGEILSGSRGLKLTRHATPEEMTDALNRLRSQVREMQRRLLETEKVWHSR